jgi:hypothetical protein
MPLQLMKDLLRLHPVIVQRDLRMRSLRRRRVGRACAVADERHVGCVQAGAPRLCFLLAHATLDAKSSRCVIYRQQATPLADGKRLRWWQTKPLGLDLRVVAVKVQMQDGPHGR